MIVLVISLAKVKPERKGSSRVFRMKWTPRAPSEVLLPETPCLRLGTIDFIIDFFSIVFVRDMLTVDILFFMSCINLVGNLEFLHHVVVCLLLSFARFHLLATSSNGGVSTSLVDRTI
jgi:hypothetical protein